MHHSVAPPTLIDFLPVFILLIFFAVSIAYMRRRGYKGAFGDNVIVRCREGHLFTTIWIPGISLKAIRLGPIRYQYCPIGNHWSFVEFVNVAELTDEQRRRAARYRDSRIP